MIFAIFIIYSLFQDMAHNHNPLLARVKQLIYPKGGYNNPSKIENMVLLLYLIW